MKDENEISVAERKKKQPSGYLFIAAGCMFFLAAFLGEQSALAGVGVAFIAVGATFLSKSK